MTAQRSGIVGVRLDAAGERVRAGNARLQLRARGRQAAKPLPLGHDPEPVGRRELADDPVAPALVVGRRPEAAARLVVELEPVQEGVEGEVEVEPRLLAVRDHVDTRAQLVADGRPDRVASRLLAVVRAELVEVQRLPARASRGTDSCR